MRGKIKFVGASAVAMLALLPTVSNADTAQTITSTRQTVTVGGTAYGSDEGNAGPELYYDQANSGGGSTAITANRPDTMAGDTGSLEIHGDRSRYIIGSLYDYTNAPSFSLASLRSFTFDWNVDQSTSAQLHAAPVARVIVADSNNERAELIWEYVYNGGTAGVAAPEDQWFNAGANSVWYANLRAPNSGGSEPLATFKANSQADTTGFGTAGNNGTGPGVITVNGNQLNLALSSWAQYFSSDARIIGFSFGAGSGFGSGFTGYVDNAAITTAAGTDRLNFETAATAVPEPATWAMMLIGFGGVAGATRHRRRKAALHLA